MQDSVINDKVEVLTGEDTGEELPYLPSEVVVPEIKSPQQLAPLSPLQRYLLEIRRYPLLNPEDEHDLALQAHNNQSVYAKQRLITANLRLVVKIAMEYGRAYAQILDLIQEGNAGLIQAVNRFDPHRGVKLSTYSAWWIRAYILKFLMDNKSLVRMGTTDAQRRLFFRLRAEADKMYALTQRFEPKLLAETLGVKEQEVIEMQGRLTKNDVSLDAPLNHGDSQSQSIAHSLPSSTPTPESIIEDREVLFLLRKELKNLEIDWNDREKYIFTRRIMAEEPITLQELGDYFGITRERARQLESQLIQKIKKSVLPRLSL